MPLNKSFREHLNETKVAREGDLASYSEPLEELSQNLLQKYVKKATKSVKNLSNGPYSDKNDNKAFKRKMYASYAKHTRLKEEIVRHSENKKAYVETVKDGFKASNRHGNVKLFNQHGKASAYKHAGLNEEEQLDELSTETLTKYAVKASKSRHRLEGEKRGSMNKIKRHDSSAISSFYAGHDSLADYHRQKKRQEVDQWNKFRKKSSRREKGITTAVNKIASKAMPVGVHEEEQLDERQLHDPVYLTVVNRRATKSPAVLHRKNRKMKGMFRKNKTQYVTQQHFKARSQHDALHFTSRSKHQLTDRWRDQRLVRMKLLKKNKNVHEDAQYLKNRQLIHQAHAQAGREIGKGERDPELRRIHMHRAKKHAHAAKVLEVIRKRKTKK